MSMTRKEQLKVLYDRRDKLRAEVDAARARLDEVENLIRMLGGEASAAVEAPRARRGDLKTLVLSLYEEAGEAGLSTQACIAAAREKGSELQQSSVSSLLSRLKADGILFYDGERYRLRKYAGPRPAAANWD